MAASRRSPSELLMGPGGVGITAPVCNN